MVMAPTQQVTQFWTQCAQNWKHSVETKISVKIAECDFLTKYFWFRHGIFLFQIAASTLWQWTRLPTVMLP